MGIADSIKDIGGAAGSLLSAQGSFASEDAYLEAKTIAEQNADIAAASSAIEQTQLSRKIYQVIGGQKSDVAGAGFAESGTALDLLRSSASQGALDKAVAQDQGIITVNSYKQQAELFQGMADAADAAGQSQEAAAAAQAAASAFDWLPFGWIICTELAKQGRMPQRWYIVGARVFAAYSEVAKQGYFLWAIPSVHHLRRHPNSLYSRFLCTVFNWRAENIAAHAGIRSARKLWRGAAVTAILWPICYGLGACLAIAGRKMNWMTVYGR